MSEEQQNTSTGIESSIQVDEKAPKKDYKSYKLILFIIIFIVGTICLVRKENVNRVSAEHFLRETIPVTNNFTLISADSPIQLKLTLANKILTEVKKKNVNIDIRPQDLRRIYCKYRNNDTLYTIDLYSGADGKLFYLKTPEKWKF